MNNMQYRRDIDGLRAIAVLPVILFHAGFEIFTGGFVGVDVFFVISGYLITTILLNELTNDDFSIARFYERRARRILPALFLVMAASTVLGYFLLMPDEFKNLGQSLVATTLFSNNILLSITSDYWDLASEFKPLLHTWSLAVEEQYYIFFPPLLAAIWRYRKENAIAILSIILISSLTLASISVTTNPKSAFYILPTRAWEIAIGAITALITFNKNYKPTAGLSENFLSSAGLVAIIGSIFLFEKNTLPPGPMLLIPTIGAALVIAFTHPKSPSGSILGSQILVQIGLISYSLYLWHQPIFSFVRAYSTERPSTSDFIAPILVVFLLSFITWKFVESPFRSSTKFSKKAILSYSFAFSLIFILAGLLINSKYGFPTRAFSAEIKIKDIDKRIYNEQVFSLKKDYFSNPEKTNLLIIGNSFARDFVNITKETFDNRNIELIYRDDIQQCIQSPSNSIFNKLIRESDVIVYASDKIRLECIKEDIYYSEKHNKRIFFVGTKDFGYNLNWLIRINQDERADKYNSIPHEIEKEEEIAASQIPQNNYISLLKNTLKNGKIPVTDHQGRLLSTDRRHLTKFGAIYFGENAVKYSPYANIFSESVN